MPHVPVKFQASNFGRLLIRTPKSQQTQILLVACTSSVYMRDLSGCHIEPLMMFNYMKASHDACRVASLTCTALAKLQSSETRIWGSLDLCRLEM